MDVVKLDRSRMQDLGDIRVCQLWFGRKAHGAGESQYRAVDIQCCPDSHRYCRRKAVVTQWFAWNKHWCGKLRHIRWMWNWNIGNIIVVVVIVIVTCGIAGACWCQRRWTALSRYCPVRRRGIFPSVSESLSYCQKRSQFSDGCILSLIHGEKHTSCSLRKTILNAFALARVLDRVPIVSPGVTGVGANHAR